MFVFVLEIVFVLMFCVCVCVYVCVYVCICVDGCISNWVCDVDDVIHADHRHAISPLPRLRISFYGSDTFLVNRT